MFWGRGSLYRNAFHVIIFFISGVGLVTGIVARISPAEAQSGLLNSTGAYLDNDFLHQGASLHTVTAISADDPLLETQIDSYTVGLGDDVISVAEQYGVNPDTIRWANIDLIGPFSTYLEPGWEISIPEIDGILHTVKEGETLSSIVQLTQGNLFEVREINNLTPPEYEITVGQKIFIPSGTTYVWEGDLNENMLRGAFQDPLSHPSCKGYLYYGGFTKSHDGVDLAKSFGCPIRSIAAGVVEFVGIWGIGGHSVIIDHGGGIKSYYYHGTGEFWVKAGDRVKAGQDIMFMGNSGNSYGTHLHLTVKQNGIAFDPEPYIPYKVVHPWF